MDRRKFISLSTLTGLHLATVKTGFSQWAGSTTPTFSLLRETFVKPTQPFQPGGYWWWFNGLMDKEGITRDLEEFKSKGMGEVLMINSADGLGGAKVPQGALFLSPEWKEL